MAEESKTEGAGGATGGVAGTLKNLSTPEGALMVSVGVFFDVIGLIPVVGDFSDIVAGIVMLLWAFTSGRLAKIMKKALLLYALTAILEAIPIVSDITPIISWVGLALGKAWPASWTGWVLWILKNS